MLQMGVIQIYQLLLKQNNRSKQETALELHIQFSHPRLEKFKKVLTCEGEPWSCAKKLLEIKAILVKCQIYKKPHPRPVVRLPLVILFQNGVAMDLKFYWKKILLNLVEHAHYQQ